MPGLLLLDGRFMIWNIYNTYGVCLRITMICQASPGLLIFIQEAIAEELIFGWENRTAWDYWHGIVMRWWRVMNGVSGKGP